MARRLIVGGNGYEAMAWKRDHGEASDVVAFWPSRLQQQIRGSDTTVVFVGTYRDRNDLRQFREVCAQKGFTLVNEELEPLGKGLEPVSEV